MRVSSDFVLLETLAMSKKKSVTGAALPETHEAAWPLNPDADTSFAGETSVSSAQLTMNEVTAASAKAARAKAQSMFHRVLAGWAADVLRLQRAERLGTAWPAPGGARRSAA